MKAMQYRSDINGLRAIAVLAVVLYHFNVPKFSGGFVGVDVFFVISGFLMTSIIFNRISGGEFSLIGFYQDRARRIIPALSVLCLSVFSIGWLILIPVDFESLGKHISSSMTFLSNILYFREVNYFDLSSKEKWLLHTWSLSVEWQFYIIYPIGIIIFSKLIGVKKTATSLILFFIISFCISVYYSNKNPAAAFYLLPARAWEMIAGGLIFLFPASFSKLTSDFLKIIGMLLIGGSIVLLSHNNVWPGWLALIPVLGAVLIIGTPNSSSIITDNSLSQFIGKISYSVYLWHWPVVVYFTYTSMTDVISILLGIFLSISLGAMSYYLIENPCRKYLKKNSSHIYIEFALILSICSLPLSVGLYIFKQNGIPQRYPFSLITSEELAAERSRYWVDGDKLNPVQKSGNKNIVIIGNSHGIDLTYALTESGLKGDITYLRTTNLCSNFGYTPNIPEFKDDCNKIWSGVIKYKDLNKAELVIIHDDWANENLPDFKLALDKIREKTSATIYVFGPKMMFKNNPSLITKDAMDNKKTTIRMINDYAKNFYEQKRFSINDDMLNLFKNKEMGDNVFYIDSIAIQCGAEVQCNIISSETKQFLYFDPGHFTLTGAKDFGIKLRAAHPELYQE